MSLEIDIRTIPHNQHRYETVGDYYEDHNKILQVEISEMSDWRYEFLVLIHELVEFHLCKKREIKEPTIKKFDEMYEAERLRGLHKDDEEPGWDVRAPYQKEHIFAEKIERVLAIALKVNWKKYSQEVNSL